MAEMYLPYHRKFRPVNIQSYIGNAKIKKTIHAFLCGDTKPQAIMMQGPAGTGKTSMARLLAKEYLCENRDTVFGACGECYNCKRLEEYIESGDSGGLMNVREVDIADSNKKQDIDEILEEAAVPTFDGGWRVYILDEYHMATTSSQNRLLKILEEPPEKVLIILCTTDPEKVIPTIISRCQYNLRVTKPTRKELASLLADVCVKEGVEPDGRALSLICVKGDFVPRKALVLLEQIVKEYKGVTYNDTVQALDIIADELFFKFFSIILEKKIDIAEYVVFIGKLKEKMDLRHFVENLIDFTLRGIYVNHGVLVDALDKSEISQYKKVFKQFNPVDLANLLDLLLNMKMSVDIESKLLLLGYRGIRRGTDTPATDDLGYLVDASKYSASSERVSGEARYIESITMTDAEKESIIKEQTKEVSAEYLATLLGGTRVYKD